MQRDVLRHRSGSLVAFFCLASLINSILLLNKYHSSIQTIALGSYEEHVDVTGPASTEKDASFQDVQHKVASLSCQRYGGPTDETASEMVYWSDIPSDANFVSPFKNYGPTSKYLTFEIDEGGGWNNVRMAMETAVALAYAMGRTLVLPPDQKMNSLRDASLNLADFYHFASVDAEHAGLDIITTQKVLEREIMSGNIRSTTGRIVFPPGNRTDWDGVGRQQARQLELWIRKTIAEAPVWNYEKCLAVFPMVPEAVDKEYWMDMVETIQKGALSPGVRIRSFQNNPTPVDAPPVDRMREQLSTRTGVCIYDKRLQEAPLLHFMGDNKSGARLLVHFYAFLFFEDWKQDLWMKRFIRDHLRYVDEIQCAAARVVEALLIKSKEKGSEDGIFDSLHIRRGDFDSQFPYANVEAPDIYKNLKDVLEEGATVYIATDEHDKSFFDPLREQYSVFFLDDFKDELGDINTNYYGMVEQLVASRGRTFAGTIESTFTGYINRIRGYHSQKNKLEGHLSGRIRSYYVAPRSWKNKMTNYMALRPPFWGREWPVSWRDIDRGIVKEPNKTD